MKTVMTAMNLKKGDTVLIIAGRAKGQRGPVEKVVSLTNRIVVTGVNMRTKSLKRSQSHPRGGIIQFPGSLSRSSAMILCPHCTKPTRIGHTVGEDGKKYRTCKLCNGSLDVR